MQTKTQITLPALVLSTLLLWGCGGSDEGTTPSTSDASRLSLNAVSGALRVTLFWTGASRVDLSYSTDYQCDWSNYSVCPDSGLIPQAFGGRQVLTVQENGLQPGVSYHFVAEANGQRTPPATARARSAADETHLERLASELRPGEVRPLEADLPEGFRNWTEFFSHTFTSDCPDQWGEQGHWYREREQTFFLGDRTQGSQQRDPNDDDIIFLSYLAGENQWVHNSKTGVRDSNDHHPYSQMALDEKRDRYYRIQGNAIWIYDIAADPRGHYDGPRAWTRIDHDFPAGRNSPKEVHEALDRIVMADDNGNVYGINPDSLSDQIVLGTRPGQRAYQSLMTYNRVRNELLWIGGTNSDTARMVTLVDANGNVIAKNDAPGEVAIGITEARVFYDPASGNYLLLDRRGSSMRGLLWEYDPDRDEWTIVRDWEDPEIAHEWPGPYCGHVMIPIDELGVILWQTRYGTAVYRHGSNPDPPVSADQEEQRDVAPPPVAFEGDHSFYRIAAEMAPGEFRAVQTAFPEGVDSMAGMNNSSWHPDADPGGTFGVGWTDRHVFDPDTGRLFNALMRGSDTTSITWLEPDLSWTGILSPPEARMGGRRPYNRLMTAGDGYLYWAPSSPNDQIGTLTRAPFSDPSRWEDVGAPPIPPAAAGNIGHGVGDFSTIWHPDIGKFVFYIYGRGRGDLSDAGIHDFEQGRVYVWGPGDRDWTPPHNHPDYSGTPGRTQSSGYGGTTIYNPVRREVLIYGGSANWSNPHPLGPQSTATIDHLGRFQRHGPSDLIYSAGRRRLTVDPVTGDYLLLDRDDDHIRLWVGDPPRGKPWEIMFEWDRNNAPFDRYDVWHRVTPLPGTDVLIWSDLRRGIILQRVPARH